MELSDHLPWLTKSVNRFQGEMMPRHEPPYLLRRLTFQRCRGSLPAFVVTAIPRVPTIPQQLADSGQTKCLRDVGWAREKMDVRVEGGLQSPETEGMLKLRQGDRHGEGGTQTIPPGPRREAMTAKKDVVRLPVAPTPCRPPVTSDLGRLSITFHTHSLGQVALGETAGARTRQRAVQSHTAGVTLVEKRLSNPTDGAGDFPLKMEWS
ncbi:hypothetical protein SKAU_G00339110 [Synaphobranchus kaupii]|uniref:Uncharacterized protein n=1 Tax=Synaphobranchus kaupii TaxID=118154 RepID=A0A9Q1EMU7_SYNKA|nr:hypothetical protein SKAU_G00339110 [Synaphobranchus kaupii]